MVALYEVTFVVVDLETTGCSPTADAITEVGALKVCGGEVIGTFHALVDPLESISAVLPSFVEFTRNAVFVGHNLRFDLSFLDAALAAHDYPLLTNRRVDTMALARRLVKDEVPNLRLATLADHFRTSVAPIHRAFPDATATMDLLHALFERVAGYGIFALDDLLAFAAPRRRPKK